MVHFSSFELDTIVIRLVFFLFVTPAASQEHLSFWSERVELIFLTGAAWTLPGSHKPLIGQSLSRDGAVRAPDVSLSISLSFSLSLSVSKTFLNI